MKLQISVKYWTFIQQCVFNKLLFEHFAIHIPGTVESGSVHLALYHNLHHIIISLSLIQTNALTQL